MGQFLGGYGMTPMAGRMWGWLLLCDPPEQTAAQIAEALQREPRRDQRDRPDPVDRRLHPPDDPAAATGASTSARRRRRWTRCSRTPASIYRQLREIAERGLDAAGRSPERAGPARRSSTT